MYYIAHVTLIPKPKGFVNTIKYYIIYKYIFKYVHNIYVSVNYVFVNKIVVDLYWVQYESMKIVKI